MPEVIDAHQHFWTVARGDYGWMTPDLGPLLRDFGPDDLHPLMQRTGVARTILVQAAETEAETEFLLSIAARTDWVAGVVGWADMQSSDFPARLAHWQAKPKWVGLRPMLQEHDPDRLLAPVFLENLAHVAARRVPFDILTHVRHLPALITALGRTPGLVAVIDHLSKPAIAAGGFDEWSSLMARVAAHPGIYCKVSGLVTEAGPDWTLDRIRPYIERVAALFGPHRLIFGSDWPVCTLAGSYAEVVALSRGVLSDLYGPEDLAAIFGGNATRFYGVA